MLCINENSREYQTLKKLSGLSDFVLSAYVGDFLETHDRFPYLDELPEADSSKAISEDLSLNKDNTTKTENILLATNTNTVEEATPVLNDRYRDKEIEVLEVDNKSKVYITTRPNTTQNQNGETDKLIKIATEMADIKERALANGTFMLAPNGRQTHLTEQLWLQVRTLEFKDWFGDWEKGLHIEQDNKSYYRGQYEEPIIDKNGNLILKGRKDSLYDRAGYNIEKGVSATTNMQSADDYGSNQRYAYEADVAEKYGDFDQSWEQEQELNEIAEHGYYLIQFPKNISNQIINEEEEVKIVGDVVIPKGQYVIEHISDDGGEIIATADNDASKVVDENGEPRIVYRGINDSNNNKRFVYFSDSRVDAEAYAKGLLTKGGNFFANNKDIVFAVNRLLAEKYNLPYTDLDYVDNILYDYAHDGEEYEVNDYEEYEEENEFLPFTETKRRLIGTHKEIYKSKFSKEEIQAAEKTIDLIENNKEVKELLEIIRLIDNTTFTSENDLTRQYDDSYYLEDTKRLSLLLDKYNKNLNKYKKEYTYNIQSVFLNIKNPYKEEIHSEDLLDNYKAYKNGHDGAFLLDGEHFLVKQGSQIKLATDNNGLFSSSNDNINDDYENVNSFAFFNEIIDKLQTLYGINIIPITNAELSQDRWNSITGTKGVKSFIYNGNIYINTDIATVDSPVHEFLHLLFGSMKYLNRALYDLLVGQAELFDSYDTISQNYPNRTKGDVNEEVFVTELAKYLTGLNNAISNLEQSVQNEIMYNVNRTLDTVLMGENSVKCVENPYIMNLKTLAKLVNSSTMISEKRGSLTDATLNRMMANTKSELMKNKELREECQ